MPPFALCLGEAEDVWETARQTAVTIIAAVALTMDSAFAGKVTDIAGVADYRTSDPGAFTRNHKLGGEHNPVWQTAPAWSTTRRSPVNTPYTAWSTVP